MSASAIAPCGYAPARASAPLDPGVVGLVDEHRDLLGRLIEELCDRGGDDQPDRQL